MNISARDVHEKQFHDAWRGYNQEEVDDFLDRVAETLDRLIRENRAFHQRIKELDQTVATGRETEDMLKKTLVSAQKAAEEAIAQARAKAETLIAQAEERVTKANDEARTRLATLENDLRRKTLDADRTHAAHTRDLEASIERLRSFETELKQRLKTFLEQQLRALDTLVGQQPTQPATPRSAPEPTQETPSTAGVPAGAQRLHATPSPRATDPGEAESREIGDEDAAAAGPRRGLRGLFWGDES
ncbi:MAG: DivIVA domain-containing protein [Actinomycetota bacterium]|nr:DivIVA domain-containing protein [Actinomycetota bacterium]